MPTNPSGTPSIDFGRSPSAQESQFRDLLGFIGGPDSKHYSEELRTVMRQIALETFAPRFAAFQEALLANQRAASGSPQELLTSFSGQINQIQQQLQSQMQTINRQGGYAMGGQRKRAQGQALGTALAGYQGLMAQNVLGGQQGLLNMASNMSPVISKNIPAQQTSTQTAPPDYAAYGQAAMSLMGMGKDIFAGLQNPAASMGNIGNLPMGVSNVNMMPQTFGPQSMALPPAVNPMTMGPPMPAMSATPPIVTW